MSKVYSYGIELNIDDVSFANNSISNAIELACEESDELCSGVVGPSFATSGPGSGWCKKFDVSDFAIAASDNGCNYVDSGDGRLAEVTQDDAGDCSVEWSEESVVTLLTPTIEEVDADPEAAKAMLRAIDDEQCIAECADDWKGVRAWLEVSEYAALERIDGRRVAKNKILYFDDNTRCWYTGDVEDLKSLRELMGSDDELISNDAYSHWCSMTSHDEFETEEDAIASLTE